jgi:hypothetical protein
VWLAASPAASQVLEPPPRAYRGLFGGGPPPDPARTRQEFTVAGNLLGGYDDNLVPPSVGNILEPYPSGYTGFWDAGVRYWLGRDLRSLELKGRGFMNTYRNVGIGANYGGEQSIRARTTLGRRTELEVAEDFRYEPFFTLGLFGPIQGFDLSGTPDVNPTNAISERRSKSLYASTSVGHRWTRKTRTDFSVSFNKTTFDGIAFDRQALAGAVSFEHSIGRTLGVVAAYRPSNSNFIDEPGGELPVISHTLDVGLNYRRRFTRTRALTWSFGAGPQRLTIGDAGSRVRIDDYWASSGYATMRWDIGRSWSVAGDYRRSVSVLEGVSPDPFLSNVALVTAGGFPRRWLESVFTVGYSNGETPRRIDVASLPGKYDGVAATAQARIRLSRFWSALLSFNHYQYYLNAFASESLRVAPELHRNAVRVGITWSLPLVGSFRGRPGLPADGRD